MQTAKFTMLTLFFCCLLAACGFKGPLYLPEDEPVASTETTRDAKATEKEKEEKEKDGGS